MRICSFLRQLREKEEGKLFFDCLCFLPQMEGINKVLKPGTGLFTRILERKHMDLANSFWRRTEIKGWENFRFLLRLFGKTKKA